MSYYIVLHGSLGSGKSTNASKLAGTLQAQQVMLDEVLKEHNLDDAKQNQGCISAANFMKGLDIVIPHVREYLHNGTVVIFDGCFYHEAVMQHLIQGLSFPHYIFTLNAPLEVCIERDVHREKTLGEMAARAVYQLVANNDFGIVIDASKGLEETYREIVKHLPHSALEER